MTIDEARENIGATVIFRSPTSSFTEEGVITSVGSEYVFVRYRHQHPTADGQATAVGLLDLAPH